MKKLTQEEYIRMCEKSHGDKYDYSLLEYKRLSDKIKIICPDHGIFKQNAKNHRDGQGCKLCSGKYKRTKELFVSRIFKLNY